MGKHIFTGKNIIDAINNGLKELNEKQENVDINVLKESGFLSKAKIEIVTKTDTKKEEVKTQQSNKKNKNLKFEKNIDKNKKNKESKNFKKNSTREKTITNTKDPVVFLEKLIAEIDSKIKIKTFEEGKEISIVLEGGKSNTLIGKRGETLYAIQNILNTIEKNNHLENKNSKFYILDIEDYRKKRKKSLEQLAERVANKAIKTQRQQKLEPMNAYERKIIHDSLSNKEVKTYSKGEEPKRYLIIEKK